MLGHHDSFQPTLNRHQMQVARGQNIGHLIRRAKGQELDLADALGRQSSTWDERPLTHENKTHRFVIQQFGCLNDRFPRSIKAQVAGMEHHKGKSAANLLRDRMVLCATGGAARAPSRTTTTRAGSIPLAMMRSRVSSPKTMTRLARRAPIGASAPKTDPPGGAHDAADQRHLRVKVANIVNKWLAFEPGHKCAHNALERADRSWP